MSRPLRSLTLVQRLSTPLRSSHPTLRCGGIGTSYYATQAHEQVRLHPHHLPTQKPSVFGQPTSKSHPHLGEQQHPCVRHPPPLALVCDPCSRRISFADGSAHVRVLCARTVKQDEVTPGIPCAEYERRRKQLVDGLPDGSLVVCVAGHVKYMSAGEPLPHVHALENPPVSLVTVSYLVSRPLPFPFHHAPLI